MRREAASFTDAPRLGGMRRAALLAVLVVFAGAAPAQTGVASSATESGKIVFERDDGVYAVNPDGTSLTRLAAGSSPVPSPDGRRIVVSGRVVDVGAGDHAELPCAYEAAVSWSPDSTEIVCETDDGLSVVDVDGNIVRLLVPFGEEPAWSPDGRRIAFSRNLFSDEAGLYVVDAAGGNLRRVTPWPGGASPTWAPDSSRLAYIAIFDDSSDETRYRLLRIELDSGGRRELDGAVGYYGPAPAWSPNGAWIAYTTGSPREEVVLVSASGKSRRTLTRSAAGESSAAPSWSPDSKRVVYQRERISDVGIFYNLETDLFVVNVDGSGRRRLTPTYPASASSSPSWTRGRLASAATPPQRRPVLSLSSRQTLRLSRAQVLAVDGGRVAVADSDCDRVTVWQPSAQARPLQQRLCGADESVAELALAGTRVAALTSWPSNQGQWSLLYTARLGQRRPVVASGTVAWSQEEDGGGDEIGRLRGDGTLVVFNRWNHDAGTKLELWRLGARPAGRCPGTDAGDQLPGPATMCRHLQVGDGALVAGVDGARILLVGGGGVISIVSGDGRRLHTWTVGAGIWGAGIQGQRVVLMQGRMARVHGLDGRLIREWQLPTPVGDDAELRDVHGDFAVYSSGELVHLLRLSDGRDRVLTAPLAASPVDAQVEASGLYFLYNRMYTRTRGRVVFVPTARLRNLLGPPS